MRHGLFALLVLLTSPLLAQPQAPQYEELRLDSIFPAGGRRGETVKVEFKGFGNGLTSPKQIVIDGPPGIAVQELKSINGSTLEATLVIAAEAPLGRRWLRVLSERSGLTNFAQFVVGSLPEVVESEPNNEPGKAQQVATPLVLNGRINPAADLDVYRFRGKAGEKLVAAIAAHAIDVHGQYKNYGIADFGLELLDAAGRTLATSEDAIGFDPLIEHSLPADGEYLMRVQLLNYGGFPEAVYRLTLGEVPYAIGAFPPGWQRGKGMEVEFFGPNVPAGAKRPARNNFAGPEVDPAYPLRHLAYDDAFSSGLDVPVVVGDLPEALETEPNDDQAHATPLVWPITLNGRLPSAGDADWYRVELAAGKKVWFDVIAHRFLRSPIDSQVQVFDASGKLLVENDDDTSSPPAYESFHDYKTTDSKLLFAAPASGAFFVRVSDQSGGGGPRAVYRFSVYEAEPDFHLRHFPDGVPIWGPGSTACLLVRFDRFADCKDDIEARVEGLPPGWSAKSAVSLGPTPDRPINNHQQTAFLSITAPVDAQVGDCVPLCVVGRAKRADGTLLERRSLPLTLYYTSDTGFFRASPISRVAVAKAQGPWLEASAGELTGRPGDTLNIPVRVHNAKDLKEMPTVVNLATNGVACGLNAPRTLPIQEGMVLVPLTLPAEMPIGKFGVTVAQTWRSDIRVGMPGPCTALIPLTVVPAK